MQSAIAAAFKTPEVLAMFARRQPEQLRQRLAQVERDEKIKLLTRESCREQKLEILTALKRLHEPLTDREQLFLQQNSSQSHDLEQVTEDNVDHALFSSLTSRD